MFDQQDTPDIRTYLRPIGRRKWLIAAIVVLITAGSYAYYSQEPKVYEASTRILLESSGGSILSPGGGEGSDRTIQAQAELLTSRDVAATVARQLGRPEQASEFAGSVSAEALAGSDFITITARRPTAESAARVANAFARGFIELRDDRQRERVQREISRAQAQLAQLPGGPDTAADRATLRDTIRQLQLALAGTTGAATQVDPARPPASAASPKVARNTALAFVLSLLGAIGLAYALEAFDRRPRRLEEFRKLYDMPLLAVLPHASKKAPLHREAERAAVSPALTEPFRQLRTSIEFAAIDRPFKRILITSAIAGEGKSTVVRNLAIVMREAGYRVALVDADLRRPQLSRFFTSGSDESANQNSGSRQPGLTDVLAGRRELEQTLVHAPVHVHEFGNLLNVESGSTKESNSDPASASDSAVVSLLPAGQQPPDPQAVLATDRTKLVIEELAESHDIVLIDSPPMLHVTDAAVLAPWVDAIIVVARFGEVTRENARRVPEVLGQVPDARPLGIVVNDVPEQEGVGYGYAYGYG